MNRTYKSVWNASLGSYVAVAEHESARGKPSRSGRARKSVAPRAVSAALVLEPRIVFDAALVATADAAAVAEPMPSADDLTAGMGQPDDGAEPAGFAETPVAAQADVAAGHAEDETEAAADLSADNGLTHAGADAATTNAEAGAQADTGLGDAETEPVADTTELVGDEELPALGDVDATGAATEIVFIDWVAADVGNYINNPALEIVYLDSGSDGVEQMAEALAGREGITAIHIVSHGVEGQLMLGNTVLTSATMQAQHGEALEQISGALSDDADILIYGCNFTEGEEGLGAANMLADLTGADVAASTDTTGSADRGGDWQLETHIGHVEAVSLAPSAWIGNLDLVINNVGSAGAPALANAIMGAGVVVNSATYSGGPDQAGIFQTGAGLSFGSNVIDFTDGAIFTTATNTSTVGGTDTGNVSQDAPGIDGDAQFNAVSGGVATFDASYIDIQFTPDILPGTNAGDTVRMTASIVFGSEEYNEYVYAGFNDSIGIWVNGTNVALAPNGLPIGIDTINDAATINPSNGNATNDPNPGHSTTVFTSANPSLYVNNEGGTYNTRMDGFTVTLSLSFDVIVGQSNDIRIGIADTGDAAYDSWMFIRADSLQTAFVAENDNVTTPANVPATVDITANDFNLNGGPLQIVAINGSPVSTGSTVTLASGVDLTIGSGGQVTVTGDGINAATDSFTYTVQNSDGDTTHATVTVNITEANVGPVAANDAFSASEDGGATVVGNAVTNDSDANGDTLTAVIQSGTAGSGGGLFDLASDGSVTFDANGEFESLAAGETAVTSISYVVQDPHGESATATISVTVNGANDAPTLVGGGQPSDQTGQDGQSITPLDVSGAFDDPDGDTLTYSVSGLPAG
ncbi:DUF4347 domain-containing protein, partial [Hydrogenophaga sp. 5NK40-0174]|uniref:DUF4347 domain-containing protein n=1 Tax=Hydrogenophaga sp. 5NK40-0174 TaxID=3127649 RepID=UPI0033405BC8